MLLVGVPYPLLNLLSGTTEKSGSRDGCQNLKAIGTVADDALVVMFTMQLLQQR